MQTLVEIAPFPFVEVSELREKYTFNITPWSLGIGVAKKGLRILYSDDEDEDEEDNGLAVAATFAGSVGNIFKGTSPKTSPVRPAPNKGQQNKAMMQHQQGPSQQNVDKERLTVDISALRQQYKKLRQRQQQAHIILSSAWNKNGILGVDQENPSKTSVTNASTAMNHLLLGKKPLVTSKPRRPVNPGAIPSPKVRRTSSSSSSNNKPTLNSTPKNATQYACPQPEVVPTSKLKKRKKKKNRAENHLDSSSSSTTEVGCTNDNTDDEDEAFDTVDDLPKDDQDMDEQTSSILKSSKSNFELGQQEIEELGASEVLKKANHSESDLSSLESKTEKKFLDELLEEFDKHSSISNGGNHKKDQQRDERALQIINENSEILQKLMSKEKPKISQTSSNGSSNSNYSTKTTAITLQSNPATKPITFNPFPNSARANRKPKEVGRKLGLYK